MRRRLISQLSTGLLLVLVLSAMSSGSATAREPGEILVKFRPGVSGQEIADAHLENSDTVKAGAPGIGGPDASQKEGGPYHTYPSQSGSLTTGEAVPAAMTPFLYKPYDAGLTDFFGTNTRGYFDHTYPTAFDTKQGAPNVPGMLDYLGRSTTKYDSHDGDDFWIPVGSNVYAPATGTILYSGANPGGSSDMGIIGIRPDADTSYKVDLVHLRTIRVAQGQHVTHGQLVGTSGFATQAHIHLGVYHNGKRVDSMGWFGPGADPCPNAAPGLYNGMNYLGCEASVWLWADESPPNSQPTYQGQYISQSYHDTMTAGSTQTAQIQLKNIGTATWDGNTHLVVIPRDSPSPFYDPSTWISANRAAAADTVAPGQVATFNFVLRAPSTPGHYHLGFACILSIIAGEHGNATAATL